MKVFVKRYPEKGEFPEKSGWYLGSGAIHQYSVDNGFYDTVKWWLEEIELPSEEEIEQESNSYYFDLEEKREKARDFRGQVAGRHPDMLTSREMFSQMSGFVDGVKFLKNLLKQK